MAPVVRELQRRRSQFESVICVTGQHREMLDQIMKSFALKADFDLNLMTHAQSPTEVAARVLTDLPGVLRKVRPDMMRVEGDTTASCAAALQAFLEREMVGHVVGALRTANNEQPFPECMNRRVLW